MIFQEIYKADLTRYDRIGKYEKSFHYYLRKAQTCTNKVLKNYYRWQFSRIKRKQGIEISWQTQIGKGFYLGHPYNITINPNAIIGENCNIHKGAVIGRENRGVRTGVPIIGDKVWIGINAAIVGKVIIGNDVLIAPNSYVNCDVPDHSVAFGNPCIIKHRENATEGYINRIS